MSKVHYEDVPDEVLRTLNAWHGGQRKPTYAVLSSFTAGRDVEADLVEDAASELVVTYRQMRDLQRTRGIIGGDSHRGMQELSNTISWLEYAASSARKGQRALENPSDKTVNALFAVGGIAVGFGLIFWMVKAMAPKKEEPKPQPQPQLPTPPIVPVSAMESVSRVYQRFIENLDQQNMKCSAPTFVFEGPTRQALEKAWQLTTRAPMGGRGIVAVAVPANYPVKVDCNWRRVCLDDGSCMGVVGL